MELLQCFKSGTKIDSTEVCKIVQSSYDRLKDERRILQYNQGCLWYMTSEYFISTYKDCLLIYKAKPFLNFIIFILECPPISLNQDYKLEKHIIEEANALGVNCRMNEYELKLYGFDAKQYEQVDSYKGDFIYSPENLNLVGKDFEQDRSALNRIRKNPDITVEYYNQAEYAKNRHLHKELHDTAELWKLKKKATGRTTEGTNFHLHEYIDLLPQAVDGCAIVIRYKSQVVGYSISEYIGGNNVSMPDRKLVMDDIPSMSQAFRAINYLEIEYWYNRLGQPADLLCNFGSSGDSKPLYETKRRLHPKYILLNYKKRKSALPGLHLDLVQMLKPTKVKKGIF